MSVTATSDATTNRTGSARPAPFTLQCAVSFVSNAPRQPWLTNADTFNHRSAARLPSFRLRTTRRVDGGWKPREKPASSTPITSTGLKWPAVSFSRDIAANAKKPSIWISILFEEMTVDGAFALVEQRRCKPRPRRCAEPRDPFNNRPAPSAALYRASAHHQVEACKVNAFWERLSRPFVGRFYIFRHHRSAPSKVRTEDSAPASTAWAWSRCLARRAWISTAQLIIIIRRSRPTTACHYSVSLDLHLIISVPTAACITGIRLHRAFTRWPAWFNTTHMPTGTPLHELSSPGVTSHKCRQ
ncbi:hypothetical protein WI664_19110 [Vibrio cholerae]